MSGNLDLSAEVRALFEVKLREFAAFCASEWIMTEKDMAALHDEKGPEYLDGYNTALTDGLAGAVDFWLGEFGP